MGRQCGYLPGVRRAGGPLAGVHPLPQEVLVWPSPAVRAVRHGTQIRAIKASWMDLTLQWCGGSFGPSTAAFGTTTFVRDGGVLSQVLQEFSPQTARVDE